MFTSLSSHHYISNSLIYVNIIYIITMLLLQSVLLIKAFAFPFWGLNICVDFDLRDSKKVENMKKLNNIIFHDKNIDIDKTA